MNNKTKHTAGEWQTSKTVNDITIHSEGKDVALVYQYSRSVDEEEATANARLIAAAPELLSNCMATLEDLENDNMGKNSETYQMAIENLREAISKAIHG